MIKLNKITSIITFASLTASSFAMEAAPLFPNDMKAASAAASGVYDLTTETQGEQLINLPNYQILKFKSADEGSIQGVTLYNEKSNTAIVSFRGTKSLDDWKANLGIGCSIARAIHHTNYKENGLDVRIPDYFSSLVTRKIDGLFGANSSSTIKVNMLNLPFAGFIDTAISFNPLIDELKTSTMIVGGGMTGGFTLGAGVGSVMPGVGTLVGGLIMGGIGTVTSSIYAGGNMVYKGVKCVTDRTYEREFHIQSLEKTIDLNPVKLYTLDACQFLQDSYKKISDECNPDQRPNIIVTGHSLGRFLAGSAFLNFLGTQEDAIGIDLNSISNFQNIAFNGPSGFQGLPYLPCFAETNNKNFITKGLEYVAGHQDMMHHIIRSNDLVGNLGRELDFSRIIEIPDVVRTEGVEAPAHALSNHGIKPIMYQLHQ